MKLIELLARELKEWPSDSDYDVTSMTQRADGDIDTWDTTGHQFTEGEWFVSGTIPVDRFNFEDGVLADDHATAVVTRAEWEATQATTTPTLETMLAEWRDLEARAQAAQAEADALFEHAGQCHGEIVVRLAELGWGAPRGRVEPVVTLDMTDPLNWLPGDVVKYIHTDHGRQFISGNSYILDYISDGGETVGVVHDSEGDSNGFNSRFFEWIIRPSTQQ